MAQPSNLNKHDLQDTISIIIGMPTDQENNIPGNVAEAVITEIISWVLAL